MLMALRPSATWLSIQSRWISHAEGVATGFRAGGHPGGFCFSGDTSDRLAIHAEHPLDLALGLARIQQGLHRNPQIRLQDVHSRPLLFEKRAQRNVPPPL